MKSKYVAFGLALLGAAVLTACGGGSGNIALGVSVSGISKDGLILSNGSDTLNIPINGGTYYFPTLLETDAHFDIQTKSVPPNVTCQVFNGTGSINYFTQLQASVVCGNVPYNLGGTLTGLTSGVLVLANGSATVSLPAGTTNWSFPVKVPNEQPYGITVLSKPDNLTCTIANASGFMPVADVTNVAVTCR